MSITADLIRGHTETVILAHLMQKDSYGYEINKDIKNASGGRFELKEATLYTAFKRLEELGFITAYWGGEETGGARRKYYSITQEGKEAYKKLYADWQITKEIIDHLLWEGQENA